MEILKGAEGSKHQILRNQISAAFLEPVCVHIDLIKLVNCTNGVSRVLDGVSVVHTCTCTTMYNIIFKTCTFPLDFETFF